MVKNQKHTVKKFSLIALIIIIIGICIYFLSPYIDSFVFRIKSGSFDDFKNNISTEESYFLKYDSPYWGGNGEGETYELTENNKVFYSDDVVKIDDGIYITGIKGITKWGMIVRIYSRKDFTLKEPYRLESELLNWPFYLTSANSIGGKFPHLRNTESVLSDAVMGKSAVVYMASPSKLENDEIVIYCFDGEKYKNRKEIKIKVSCDEIK